MVRSARKGSFVGIAAIAAAALGMAACGGGDESSTAPPPSTGTTAAATDPPAETSATEADLSGVKSYLLDHTSALTAASADFLAGAQRVLRPRRSRRLRPRHSLGAERRRGRPADRAVEGDVDHGQSRLRGDGGRRRGTPSLAEYDVILDAGSSAAEDPESAVPFDLDARRRNRARAARESLQPHRGRPVGHPSRGARQAVDRRRSRRRRQRGVRRGASRRGVPARRRAGVRPVRERARGRRGGVGTRRLRRAHRARRHGADDGRVLRPVEGVALRRRATRPARRPSTSSRGSRTSTTSSAASTSSTPASSR